MWQLKSIFKIGDDAAEVVLVKGELADGEEDNRETQAFTWTRDASQSVPSFALMVKGEVEAHLDALNAAPAREDVTLDYEKYLQAEAVGETAPITDDTETPLPSKRSFWSFFTLTKKA